MLRFTGRSTCLLAALLVLSNPVVNADEQSNNEIAGVLDKPISINSASQSQEALRNALNAELAELKKLSPDELMNRAKKGERAAQLLVAEAFAREAAALSFATEAANAAVRDAVYWYSLAAMSGIPGSPSLDHVGVKFYPISMQRSR